MTSMAVYWGQEAGNTAKILITALIPIIGALVLYLLSRLAYPRHRHFTYSQPYDRQHIITKRVI